MSRLRKGLKVVAGFAAVGLLLPWLLLAYYTIAHRMGYYPNTMLLVYLCPTSIMALGLDNASILVGLFGWLLIGLSNAVLYAIPGTLLGTVVGLWKSN